MILPVKQRRGCSPWALTGCGCGLIAGIGILLIFILLGIQMYKARLDPTWDRLAYADCQRNFRLIGRALVSYRQDYHRLPAKLEDLMPRYLDAKALSCPLLARHLGKGYTYTPGAKRPTDRLVTCGNHGQGFIILQRDGKIDLPNLFRR